MKTLVSLELALLSTENSAGILLTLLPNQIESLAHLQGGILFVVLYFKRDFDDLDHLQRRVT